MLFYGALRDGFMLLVLLFNKCSRFIRYAYDFQQ